MSVQNLQSKRKERGMVLLEALISILIFSIGILAIVGLLAIAINNTGEAKYRSDASLLANQLIAQMWVGNRTTASLSTNFSSPAGPSYVSWKNEIETNGTLPGIAANPPTVVVAQVPGGAATEIPTTLVTITLFWKAPEEPAGAAAHHYTAVAQLH